MNDKLIFLISQPRSGSTLLQAVLGSHPDIHTSSEPWIALPFIYALKQEGSEFEFNCSWSRSAIEAFFKDNGIEESFFNSALQSFLKALYQKALANSGKTFFLDKTPRYYEIISELVEIFPEAKFIVLYRHPLAVFNSIMYTWVKDQSDFLYYYGRDLLVAPRKLADFVSRHEDKVCLVRYEEFVSSPASEVKRICAYLGVEYLEDIINYNSDQVWAFGDKKFKNKKVPDQESIETWLNQLEDQHTLNFNYYYLKELGDELFTTMGYDFRSTFDRLKKSGPNQDDFKTWQTLLRKKYIVSIEEQRQQLKAKLQENAFKGLFRKFMT